MSPRVPRVRRAAWMLTAFYAGFHFVMTHIPPGRMPPARLPDKTLHFLSFGFLTGCFYVAMWLGGASIRTAAWVTLVWIALFGAIDELLQAPIGRMPELSDWFADVAAAVIAVACFSLFRAVGGKRAKPVPAAPATD